MAQQIGWIYQEAYTPQKICETLHEKDHGSSPKVDVFMVPNAGHLLMLQNPEGTNAGMIYGAGGKANKDDLPHLMDPGTEELHESWIEQTLEGRKTKHPSQTPIATSSSKRPKRRTTTASRNLPFLLWWMFIVLCLSLFSFCTTSAFSTSSPITSLRRSTLPDTLLLRRDTMPLIFAKNKSLSDDGTDKKERRWWPFFRKDRQRFRDRVYSRNVGEIKMREAEELGGVPRSDRYSSVRILLLISFNGSMSMVSYTFSQIVVFLM